MTITVRLKVKMYLQLLKSVCGEKSSFSFGSKGIKPCSSVWFITSRGMQFAELPFLGGFHMGAGTCQAIATSLIIRSNYLWQDQPLAGHLLLVISKGGESQVLCHMPVFPVHGKLRQEDWEVKANLGYIGRPCLKNLRAGDAVQR
jgi:hypothetical protein